MAQKAKTGKKANLSTELFFWAQALVLALVALVVINIFFIRISGVVGSSMFPTLHDKDKVFVRVIGYSQPERGDIVVVTAPEYGPEPLVKRIIGLPGDTIDIDEYTGTVYVNGEAQNEPYINEAIRNFGDLAYPFEVPQGCVFFMGDNRNHSTDSRWSMIGAQPIEHIVGKVIFRVLPLGSIGTVK